jgi:hypothetical protein
MRSFFGELVLWVFFRIPVLAALAFAVYVFLNIVIGGLALCPPRAWC